MLVWSNPDVPALVGAVSPEKRPYVLFFLIAWHTRPSIRMACARLGRAIANVCSAVGQPGMCVDKLCWSDGPGAARCPRAQRAPPCPRGSLFWPSSAILSKNAYNPTYSHWPRFQITGQMPHHRPLQVPPGSLLAAGDRGEVSLSIPDSVWQPGRNRENRRFGQNSKVFWWGFQE